MSNANDPAFPLHYVTKNEYDVEFHQHVPGMSKRELIAMHCLAGLLSNPAREEIDYAEECDLAVTSADQLLIALDEPPVDPDLTKGPQ